MKLKRIGIGLFFLLIFVVGAGSILYTMIRLNNHPEFVSGEFNPEVDKIEKAQGQVITLTETQAGHRKWVLKMKEIRYSKNKSVADLKTVQGLVYNDADKVLFTFKAPKGQYFKDEGKIVLEDGAKMISPTAKAYIQSPTMVWSSREGSVLATGGVKMAKKDVGTTQAQQASFPMDFSEIRFSGHARTVLK